MKIETKCIRAGYEPQNGDPVVVPIVQSTTFRYESTEDLADLFDLKANGYFYTRIGNPTVDAVEKKIAALEGGVGALCTSSGSAASMLAILNIVSCGDHLISSSNIYGGTFNLLAKTLKKFGIETTFIDQNWPAAEIAKLFRPNTKLIFGETLANPALTVLDIEKFANLAHEHNVPLIVDNTFPTPVLCQPLKFGADVVIHSTTKYMDGNAVQMGGAIVDGSSFDWTKFPEFVEPDDSYHGLIYTQAFGNLAYIVKARVQLMRDLGCCQSPQGAFYTNIGLQTLPLRMREVSKNALTIAQWLQKHNKILSVKYPGLPADPDYERACKYLPDGASGVISFVIKGGRQAAIKFIDNLKLIYLETHVADIRTSVLHPASSTHRQLNDEQLTQAGISPGMIRFSTGLENIDDILADVEQALEKA